MIKSNLESISTDSVVNINEYMSRLDIEAKDEIEAEGLLLENKYDQE
jgi:hypothetical protein